MGIVAPPTPPTSLLDFFGSVPFHAAILRTLMRRSGVADAAIQVAGTVKHEASLVYTPDSLRAITVASWTKANRQDLDDVEALAADIGVALRYGVMVKVEDLLLNGAPADADGAAVPGILDDPFHADDHRDEPRPRDRAGEGAAAPSGVVPNFAAASPVTIEAEEERTGDRTAHYVRTIDDQGRVRRLPLVASTALDYGRGAPRRQPRGRAPRRPPGHLADRSPGSDQDDMLRNRVTVLVEGRWTPPRHGPHGVRQLRALTRTRPTLGWAGG